jgi:Na+/proline symporter
MNDPVVFGVAFWGFLVLYGVGMYALSPRAVGRAGFFDGHDEAGRPAGTWALGASIFISWIFAKSITNAANLGATYGIVGGLAYATYWLSIPLAGWAILRLRRRYGATSLMSFLTGRHGRLAALAFSIAILVRLFNEVWSNTAVVGGYYGPAGSTGFIGAALLFTAATLFYSLKGGLRSSIYTDVLQTGLFVLFFAVVLLLVLPTHGPVALASTGDFRLDAGVDLLLVAALQVLSYPFHDPVLTDRGFITEEKRMLRAFVWAGALGFVCILLFSLVGVHARLEGLAGGDNVPAALARSMGPAALFVMTIVMVAAAGSTLDSTFSSLARHVAQELPQLAGRPEPRRAIALGMGAMALFAIIGNLPMIAGTDILKATTISGTMVIGLAPIFLLAGFTQPGTRAAKWSFHLAFWTGLALGVLLAMGGIPDSWAIGTGKYAKLLGVNLYGLLLCTVGYLLPPLIAGRMR